MRFLTLFLGGLFFSFSLLAQNIDIKMLRQINLHRNESWDPGMKFVSKTVTPVEFIVPAGFFITSMLKKDSTSFHKSMVIGASLLSATVITTGLKYGLNRERPFNTYPDLEKLDEGGSPSFPSGHTSAAFSLATSVSLAYPKWYVVIPAYGWATSVGYSRMHLGVHYPSDVLAGALIGSGTAFFCYKLNRWIFRK